MTKTESNRLAAIICILLEIDPQGLPLELLAQDRILSYRLYRLGFFRDMIAEGIALKEGADSSDALGYYLDAAYSD